MDSIADLYVPISYLVAELNLPPTSVRFHMTKRNKPINKVGGRFCYFRVDADEVIASVRAEYAAKAARVGAAV